MSKDINAVELGRRGGKKTAELYGPDHYREIQKKSRRSIHRVSYLKKNGCICDAAKLRNSFKEEGQYRHDPECPFCR